MIIKMKRFYAMILAVTMSFAVLSAVPVSVSANTTGYSSWFAKLPTLTDQTVANIQANTTVNDANYAEFYDYPNQPYRRISTSSNSVKVSSIQTWNETGGNDRRGYAILKLDQVDDIYGTNKGTYVYDVDLNINLTGEVTEKGDRTPLSTSGGSRTNMNGVYIGFFGGADGAETPGYGYSVINLFRDKAVETSERVSNDRAVELATFAGEGLENGKYKMVYEYATGTSASEAKANIYMYKYNADGVTYNTTPVMSVIGKNLKTMPGSTSKEQWSSQTKESLGWIQIGVRTPDIGSYIEVTKASFSKLPEGITLSEASVLMEINATKQLSATVLPSDATNKKVIWTSSNQGVATVNENGLVTAVSSGTATITATTESGGKTAECVVTVNEPAASSYSEWFSTLPTLTDQTIENIQANTRVNDANYAEFYDYPNQPYRRISTSSNSVKVSSVQTWNESGGNDRRGYAILKLDQVDDIYGTNKGTYVYDVDLNINLTGEVTEKGDRTPLSTSGGSRTNMNGVYIGFFGGADGAETPGYGYSVINLFRDKAVETSERVSNDRAVELATFAGEGLENGKYKMVYEYATGTSASEAKANIYMYKYNADGVTYNTTPVMSVIGKNLKTMPGSTSKEQWSSQTKESLGWIQIGVRTPDIGSYIEVTKASFSKLPEGITLSEASVLMEINATKQLSATVLPSDATNKKVIWTSSNQGVATVNENGLVTAVSSGTATITATTESGGKTAECVVTVNEPAASSYGEWFSTLPTLTDQTIENIQANTRVNDANYAEFYDDTKQQFRRFSTTQNSIKVSSAQTWDETGAADRRGYAVLKLAQVDDIYGANQGTYIYDVDFNLTLTGEDALAPVSTAGERKAHCVYLGFYGGTESYDDAASYSVINLYRDKIIESWERDNNDKGELASFDGEGMTNGKYNIKYEYVTGSSASDAKVNIILTKYQSDGVTLENIPLAEISNKKLKHMLSESKETYSAETSESLGWIEVGVRTPYAGSSIEITNASFGLKQNMNKDLFISKVKLYADEKLPQNRVFALENERFYSKLFVDLCVEKLNTTPSNKKINVILALYKKDGDDKRLEFADVKQCDFEKQNNYVCDFEINSFIAEDGTIIKLFVWDENGCPEDVAQEFVVGSGTDLTTRDLALIKSRLISDRYSNYIDVSSTTALLADGRFSDLTYDVSENCITALSRVNNMLKAYFSVGNNMYMNEALKEKIVAVLEDWAQNDYQSSNWWWNDIGVPNILSNSFVYPLDDIISSSTLSDLMTIARRGIPSIDENKVHKNEDAAGANLTDKLVIALRIAVLTGDTEGLETVSRLLENELQVFTQASAEYMDEYVSGSDSVADVVDYEGIAPDYSFKQHGILYTGGYGKAFTDGIATLLEWLQDTQYMPSSRAVNLYADFIIDGYAPMFKGEGSDFSIMGRYISREKEENAIKHTSKKAIEAITEYSQISRRIELMDLYDSRIVGNDSGTTFAKHYWASDYTVFHRPDYYVGVKNFSNRNISTEFINGENRYGFYLSDGATTILKTGMEYSGIYPVWDWSRIPGTTTTYLDDSSVQIGSNNNVENHMFQNGTKTFVGGVSDGIYAVSAMDYEHKHGSRNYKTSAKKAVFMFDDGFVSLGANIKGTDWFNSVNTTLNQCNLNGDVTYSEDNLSTKTLASETEGKISAKWINHDNVSYILPSAHNVTISNKSKTGNWKKINNSGSEDEITKNVFTAYINHGIRPSNDSYEYTVLPSATIDETKSYSDSPDMLTITNTNYTQSVWSKKANALGAVFYSGNQTISIGAEITGFENALSVKSSEPCIILLKKTETGWKLSVSDPTNGNISNTVITVNGVAHDVTLPTENNCGKSVTLDI